MQKKGDHQFLSVNSCFEIPFLMIFT